MMSSVYSLGMAWGWPGVGDRENSERLLTVWSNQCHIGKLKEHIGLNESQIIKVVNTMACSKVNSRVKWSRTSL